MSTARAIYARLSTDTDVTELCDDVCAMDAAQGEELPRIVYEVAEDERDRTYKGATGLVKTTVTVECHGRTYSEAKNIAAAVVTSLDNAHEEQWGGVTVKAVYYHPGTTERQEEPQPGVGSDDYIRSLIFEVWIHE